MDLQQLLAALLNPNGSQQARPQMAGAPTQVGDGNNPALLLQAQQRLAQGGQQMPPQMQPQQQAMPQQAPQGQPMQQNAPQTPQQPQGGGLGGLGGILQNIIAPQSAKKNQTVSWLVSQGYDPGTATVLASDKTALRQVILSRGQGEKPIEINGRLVNPRTFEVMADFSTPKERKIQNDANGVPRYADTGAAVYPSDQSSAGGTGFFSGKSVEAQGLNYLIDQKKLTKEQASNVAAGKPVTGPNGEIIFMTPQGIFQQAPGGGAPQPVQPGGDTSGGNIQITGPKYSEDMRKAEGFSTRADADLEILKDPTIAGAGASYGQNFAHSVPLIGNYLASNDYQKFDQAQRDFINAVLRRESGAAISASEFDNARKQYLPQPGDGPDVIKQKAENRRLAAQGLHNSADPVPAMGGAQKNPPTFSDNKAVFDAISAGKLKVGDEIIVNGQHMRVDP